MDNLVAVMSSDKGQLETLAATNASLVAINVENASTIAELTRQNCQLLSLLKSMNLCQPVGGGGCGDGGGEPYGPNGSRFRKTRDRDNDNSKFNGDGYCWTHGYRVHIGHSSSTCRSENQGHKKAATRRNTMGGSSANKDWVKK